MSVSILYLLSFSLSHFLHQPKKGVFDNIFITGEWNYPTKEQQSIARQTTPPDDDNYLQWWPHPGAGLIPTSDDSDNNFSGTPPRTLQEQALR
jgi:hypothetical protein